MSTFDDVTLTSRIQSMHHHRKLGSQTLTRGFLILHLEVVAQLQAYRHPLRVRVRELVINVVSILDCIMIAGVLVLITVQK